MANSVRNEGGKWRAVRSCAGLATMVWISACTTSPIGGPVSVAPIRPAAQEQIGLVDILYAVDASNSMGTRTGLAPERNLLASLAAAMPEGEYGVGLLLFGGREVQRIEIERFRRRELLSRVAGFHKLGGDTRLASAIDEVGRMLPGAPGRRAVVLISDGVPRGAFSPEGEDSVLRAADRLLASAGEELCLHTVQMGPSAAGASLLRRLAEKSACGSFRADGGLASASAIQRFERGVFFTAAVPEDRPRVARDSNRDGVEDGHDRCDDTPSGVVADAMGCWQPPAVRFETNSSWLLESAKQQLGRLSQILERNPDMAIRVIGHADSTGESGYNEWLSKRRADRVRSFLVHEGVAGSRITVHASGDQKPLGPNDTMDGRSQNRRAEIQLDRR